MPKRRDNADPEFKEDIGEMVKRNKKIQAKDVFDYNKNKSKTNKSKRKVKKSKY
jgi:hypothetical protein